MCTGIVEVRQVRSVLGIARVQCRKYGEAAKSQTLKMPWSELQVRVSCRGQVR